MQIPQAQSHVFDFFQHFFSMFLLIFTVFYHFGAYNKGLWPPKYSKYRYFGKYLKCSKYPKYGYIRPQDDGERVKI